MTRWIAPAVLALLWGAAWGATGGCGARPRAHAFAGTGLRFVDVSRAAGLAFVHLNGARRPLDIIRSTGSGLAWLDYDRDGWPDLFCVNGSPPDVGSGARRGHCLYRNRGDGTFEDTTARAGLRGLGQDGFGVAVGDYDGDGWPDLYVTCYGPNRLYHNRRDGTFADVTESMGAGGGASIDGAPKWSTGAAWFDADGDGDLDLYVANYCRLGPRTPRYCDFSGVKSSCSPVVYRGQPHLFLRNEGGRRFAPDPAAFAHPGRSQGRGLAVLPFDADGDGRPELLVGNDGEGNFFFRKRGRRYEEIAYRCGVALDGQGGDPASMGVDAADYDGDGRVDLVIGNFQGVPNILFQQTAPLAFQDVSVSIGIALPTRRVLTFGAGFEDFNLDGELELLFVNGHVQDNVAEMKTGVSYAQAPQLFTASGGVFRDVSGAAGPPFQQAIVGRGAAFADYDRDGDVDVAVSVNGGPVLLWRNDSNRGHWLQVELVGRRPNPEAIGSEVKVSSGNRRQVRQVLTGRSYLADSERVLTFGLGSAARVDPLEVRWPDGSRQVVPVPGVDRRIVVRQE